MRKILFFQAVDHLVGTFRVFVIEIVRDFYKTVGCTTHGREYNKCGFATLRNELADTLHSFRRADGRTAEFHYLHNLTIFNFTICLCLNVYS